VRDVDCSRAWLFGAHWRRQRTGSVEVGCGSRFDGHGSIDSVAQGAGNTERLRDVVSTWPALANEVVAVATNETRWRESARQLGDAVARQRGPGGVFASPSTRVRHRVSRDSVTCRSATWNEEALSHAGRNFRAISHCQVASNLDMDGRSQAAVFGVVVVVFAAVVVVFAVVVAIV